MCHARRGGPRTPSTTTDANLDCVFVENALFLHRSLIEKSQQNRIELVTRTTQPQQLSLRPTSPGTPRGPTLLWIQPWGNENLNGFTGVLQNDLHFPQFQTQFLHCLVADTVGGENDFADGFKVEAFMRENHPEEWRILSTTLVEFGDSGTGLVT